MPEEYVILTPLSHGIVRVERHDSNGLHDVLHVAGGQHRGIIVRKQAPSGEEEPKYDHEVSLEFFVFISNQATGETSQVFNLIQFFNFVFCSIRYLRNVVCSNFGFFRKRKIQNIKQRIAAIMQLMNFSKSY